MIGLTWDTLDNLQQFYEEKLIYKAWTIVPHPLHPLHAEFQLLPS